jgi:hypothetical protein
MNITQHIRNCIYIFKFNREKSNFAKIDMDGFPRLVNAVKQHYPTKNSWFRGQLALLIRNVREVNSYQIIDYSKAKELYDNIIPIDLSEVKVGSYVFKFTREEPIKGKRWCEYFINESGTIGVYKVHKYDESYNYWSLENYDGNWNHFTVLKENTLRSFRFATEDEIKEFKISRKNYKQKKKEIEVLQKQITKLYKEL